MLFCWGDGSYGQLGLGEEGVSQPVPLRRIPPAVGVQGVVLVACGERHTLLLLADGSLASCGDNAQGQLGKTLSAGRRRCYLPEPIQALEAQMIIYISCGKEHSLAISNQGRVFSWGAGGFGQLGTGILENSLIPKKIDSLSMYNVIQIACGQYHSIALTKDGRVFSWGQNIHGQLGLGKGLPSQATPCNISSLAGIPVAQVAAGGAHSFVLSHSGVVYGWGRNNAHQLGLNQRTSKEQIFKPYSVGALRNLEVMYVSCGDEHTAVLTKSGCVFTFGDDSAGQLGHNSSKTGPQKIDEIDGPVSQVSCGNYHTLCFSASGQLWSFGRGFLQDTESPGSDSKQEERKCIDISALLGPNELLGVQVFAGAYVNFVNIFQASACANATTSLEVLPRISQLDRGLIEKWKSAEIGSEAQQEAKREIEQIFSSPPCLTASFLKIRSAVSMDYYIPVDLQETREVLKELTVRDWIARQISYSLLDHLVPALPRSSSHQEALAVFLLVPECCVALGAHMIPSLPFQFAEAVTGLSKRSSNILENYWSLLPGPFLEQIVQMLKTWVSARLPYYNLSPQAKSWIHPLEVLKRLYKINMKATCRLQTSAFCIDEIPQKIRIEEDFWRWKLQDANSIMQNIPEEDHLISFCCFPFIYNVSTKREILHYGSFVVQEELKMKACNELVYNRALGTSDLPELPIFPLRVRRQFLVEDTWHKLSIMEDIYLKKHLLVQFENETLSYEDKGILVEFFSQVFEEVVQPKYGMFMYCEHNSPMWFPPKPSVEKNKYYLFGILCGLSIANQVTAYIPFPLALFKKLLNKKPTLSDLQELNPVVGGCLQTALDYERDDFEDMFQLCYSISWDGMDVDLIENGILTAVNNANKKDFVDKYVDYIFNKSVDDVFSEFRRGFYKVLDEQLVGFFEPEQLIKVAIGNANYNWDLYEENAVYCDIYNSTHPTIKMFWEVFHGLSLEDKKRFLGSICLKEKIKINSLDCEASHLLILSSNGKLSEHDITTQTPQIRLLKELTDKYIVQIACGDHHSMALSKGGELFAWGENEHGQLGVEKKMGHIKEPQLVLALEGIPLVMIAAGSAHSMVVSIFGTVYSWGKNTYGQLGLGDTEDRYIPAHVKALEHKKTVFISCGGEHTAVLSKDGLVCTFGSGCYGQLGHNSTCNELFPRLVAELFGAQVTQVACGRWHTLVYVPALGEVYAFGYGGEGQLGEGRISDQLVPLPLDLAVPNKHMKYRSTLGKVVKIIAGDNQSIVLHLEEKNAYTNVMQTLATVEEEKFAKWLSNSDPSCWNNIQWNIKLIFSSAACINGSFLHQREEKFRTFEETVGVDMSAVLLFFEKIASKPKVFTKVKKALKSLLGCPLYSGTSPEALRFFLIVPVLLQKQDFDSDHLLCQLAKAIWNLPQQGKQALETLWSNLEVDFFKDLVSMFQRLIGVNIFSYYKHRSSSSSKKNDYIIPLKVFQMLYQVNCRSDFKIQESNFYVPEVGKIHLNWKDFAFSYYFNLLWDPTYSDIRLALSELCQFPLILNLKDKIVMHQVECELLHQKYIMKNIVTSTMKIRRQYLLQDTWHYLRSAEESCFQHFFTMYFEGEPELKYGGLIQEFFTIISRQLCSPEAQVFKHFEDSNRIWFSYEVSTKDDIYFLIGNLFGIALHNLKIIALPFPLALFKKLANIEPTLEDLKELSPTVGRTLQIILDERYDDILKNMMLDFTIAEECKGSISEVNLKENGANIPVTSYNRKEYVDAYVDYIFNESVKKQFGDFVRGFQRGCPSTTWKMFLPIELRSILFGNTAYQWDQLEKNVKYKGFEESDETIKNFWTVFYEFPEESKKDFLAFLTGTVHIPGETMDNFSITIADINHENPDQLLPVVHTCHQTLFLPRYTDKHILTKKLLDVIENFRDFGLA